jgi:hypothetical protein
MDNGFDPNTPKILAGSRWGSWGTNFSAEMGISYRPSILMANIIREFKDPRQRQFALALYYFFISGDARLPAEILSRSALVTPRADGSLIYNPMYTAFQMANNMSNGGIVETTADAPLEVMATCDDLHGKVVVTVNNHTHTGLEVNIVLRDAPFTTAGVWGAFQLLNEYHGVDGSGLADVDGWHYAELANQTANFPVYLQPFGTAQLTVTADE